jgi:hypothetical protein
VKTLPRGNLLHLLFQQRLDIDLFAAFNFK